MPRPADPRPARGATSGFTLIEAVIVIAIMAILASAAAPMLIRALSQQREAQTRGLVKTAYEALVGARDRGVPNLATDVGFVPPATLADLRFLTTINPAAAYRNGAIPQPYPTAAAGFTWGWNGPYWGTPLQSQAGTNGLPADGWGNPLRWQANQVQSAGADGVFGTTDDVVYPPAPAPTQVQRQAQLQITVERQVYVAPPPPPTPTVTFTVQVTDRSQQALRTRTAGSFPFTGSGTGTTASLAVLPGAVSVQVTSSVGTQSQTALVGPGETRILLFRFNN